MATIQSAIESPYSVIRSCMRGVAGSPSTPAREWLSAVQNHFADAFTTEEAIAQVCSNRYRFARVPTTSQRSFDWSIPSHLSFRFRISQSQPTRRARFGRIRSCATLGWYKTHSKRSCTRHPSSSRAVSGHLLRSLSLIKPYYYWRSRRMYYARAQRPWRNASSYALSATH